MTRTDTLYKPVIQKDDTGCGIACVAALAGVTYKQAQSTARRLGIFADDPRLWSETVSVRLLLREYGLGISKREEPSKCWEALPDLASLALKWRIECGRAVWHWAVFWRGPCGAMVLDSKRSLRTNRRTDFGRMKPKWFISLTEGDWRTNC